MPKSRYYRCAFCNWTQPSTPTLTYIVQYALVAHIRMHVEEMCDG